MGALSRNLPRAGLCLALAACTTWPPPSQGGAAERGGPSIPAAGADAALVARLSCSVARFQAVRAIAEDRQQLTGRVAAAAEIAARAQREVHGGLSADAAVTIARLDAETVSIGATMSAVPQGAPPECA